MDSIQLIAEMQKAIDETLRGSLSRILYGYPDEFISMFYYAMGWEGNPSTGQGKRIRPLLVLLACHASGGQWQKALPAASAVELVHNFSLIHDDIQDGSELRRGRPSVWVKWGQPQAINTGDAMLTAAHLSLLDLTKGYDAPLANKAVEIIQEACISLTRGQYLDIAFEKQESLPLELYWQMVEGKTSALLAACLGLGALTGGANSEMVQKIMSCGLTIGAAFQVQDDWLGIWGDSQTIGKSITSDLVTKKKTFPILMGLQKNGEFQQTWQSLERISPEDARKMTALLEREGIRDLTQQKFEELYSDGFNQLSSLNFDPEKTKPLICSLQALFGRIK